MKLTLKQGLVFAGIAFAIFATALGIAFSQQAFAGITYNQPTTLQNNFLYHDFFPVATSTTATSTNDTLQPSNQSVRIDGARKIDLIYSRTGRNGNVGTSTFYPQVSYNGSTWFYFGKQVENSSTTLPAIAVSFTAPGVSLTGTSTVTRGLQITDDGYRFLRCVVVETTDGEHSCSAAVTY